MWTATETGIFTIKAMKPVGGETEKHHENDHSCNRHRARGLRRGAGGGSDKNVHDTILAEL